MSTTVNVRKLALEALLAVERDGRQSHLVIRDILQEQKGLPLRERAFFTRLTEGTIEYRLQLDHVLDQVLREPAAKTKPVVLEILRMAVYQILYMDSVPDRAAVHEAVALAEEKGLSGLKGFVNGVLRMVVRKKDELNWLDPRTEPDRALSVRYSVPVETVRVWKERYGADLTEKICASFLEDRPLTVRMIRSAAEGGKTGSVPEELIVSHILERACFLREGAELTRMGAFRGGRIYVQDLSSQIAVVSAGIRPGDRVLDLCAAPGGKSLLAAELAACEEERTAAEDMSEADRRGACGKGAVLARYISEQKTALIRENCVRCRAENVRAEAADAAVFDPALEEQFDVVIADLPCSGFGICGRKPEIKYKPYRETVTALAELQRSILPNAVRYVRPGGRLLYSTCTIAREENEDNVRWLLDTFPLRPADLRELLPKGVRELPEAQRSLRTASDGYVQLLPCDGPWDGFFFAVLVKE